MMRHRVQRTITIDEYVGVGLTASSLVTSSSVSCGYFAFKDMILVESIV